MTSAQVQMSVTNNSSFQNYPRPDDPMIQTNYTAGFKPFTIIMFQMPSYLSQCEYWLYRPILNMIPSRFKVPVTSIFFPIWSSISCTELLLKKIFDLDKKRFYEFLKAWKSYFLAVDPCRWSQHRHAQSFDVDSGNVTSGLTHLACFTFVNLALYAMQNAPFQHFVWTTKLNLQR